MVIFYGLPMVKSLNNQLFITFTIIVNVVLFFIFMYLIYRYYKAIFNFIPAGLRRFLMNFALRRIIMMAIFKGFK